MSGFQRFMRSILPKSWMAAMEADSRRWVFDCECGEVFSIWDLGGIRYKATGNSWNWAKCPHCQRGKMRQLRWLDSPVEVVDSNR